MPIVIEPYQPKHEAAVDDFNRRLQAGGAEQDLVFYRWATPRFLSKAAGSNLYNEFFLALDGDIVRGGYALKRQDFKFPDNQIRSLGYYHHPLSEGIVNKSHAVVGSLLLRDALQRSPLLYCLGMGGYDRPLPRMLVSLGWTHCLVPFYFRVLRPARFLRKMQAIRTSGARRLLMDVAAYSGAGWVAVQTWNAWVRLKAHGGQENLESTAVEEFSDWASVLWEQARQTYSLTAVRNSATLQVLYPESDKHFTRLQVRHNGETVGWAVLGEKRKDPKYGDMRVGSIVDCWALPSYEAAVIQAASECLQQQGFHLAISNQSHSAWGEALRTAGFLTAASNFIFAASKNLSSLLQPFERVKQQMHFTRADGDGLPRNF